MSTGWSPRTMIQEIDTVSSTFIGSSPKSNGVILGETDYGTRSFQIVDGNNNMFFMLKNYFKY